MEELELWGGIECTIARIGASYRNQVEETGHAARLDDLDRIAALGIGTIRYPILWEATCPDGLENARWECHDARLERLRDLGIRVIAGLVHHGSGPRYCTLADAAFPDLLARYACEVATRYPWIECFTPVNEPLTTARFCGLYGYWFPHGRSTETFLRVLANQCLGVVKSMRAIRRIRPAAKLVQTEDLGRIFSTPKLAYQTRYENERRWLSFDLLFGRVDAGHPFFDAFRNAGVAEACLLEFVDHPYLPDIVGINHYLTSDRYLDEDVSGYPPDAIGGNGRDSYADVAAVRAPVPAAERGLGPRLREAWERYRLPLAVTEVHAGCTREEQLRWLAEAWTSTKAARANGVDVRAVTVWALLGAVDWSSLLRDRHGHYESGVFDVRSNPIRRTALADAVEKLAAVGDFDHPVLDVPGWWHRPQRLHRPTPEPRIDTFGVRRILIIGRNGRLGQAVARIADRRGIAYALLSRKEIDIASRSSVAATLDCIKPWAVVNAAGYPRLPVALRDPARCRRENTTGAAVLAAATSRRGIPLVTFSSDLVFDGRAGRAYVEGDPVSPQCVYGASKADAERRVLAHHPSSLVIRTAALFGPWDDRNAPARILCCLQRGEAVATDTQPILSPTYLPDLVDTALDLLVDGASGVWHVVNEGAMSWHEVGLGIAKAARLKQDKLESGSVKKPLSRAMRSRRGIVLPHITEAMERFVRDWAAHHNQDLASTV